MAIQSVTVTFTAKRTDNTQVFSPPLTATAATKSLADANIAQQIADKVATAQNAAADLVEVQTLFGS